MSLCLNGWAGDHAGSVVGRQPYTALISITNTTIDFPYLALSTRQDIGRTVWHPGQTFLYPYIKATCLTPGAVPALVTKVDPIDDFYIYSNTNVYSLAVTPWGFERDIGKIETWKPGVHLFSIEIATDVLLDTTPNPYHNITGVTDVLAATFATVVVPAKPKNVMTLSDDSIKTILTSGGYSGLGSRMR